ncbi:hypothetical protein [Sphingobacterium rhinopitheci]|uniref:hypothetical protein n=1 Tax=Sphingobacterium rhinopitheci TaxID=2781960 RepID=UPI001F51F664|nr:hypothetical protein [Sphingobacterium rhinopitheci]MCI0921733.1 hypothetical protein [Sphingobacterium rhinopitheci]
MKSKISTIVTALLMTLSLSSFANNYSNPLKAKDAKEILLTYAECTSIGNTDYNNFLFADDFQYENASNNSKSGKREYLKYLKENKGLNYNCVTSSEILDITGKTAIAKSIYKFDTFSRVDYITLAQTKEGWKVSKVITTYL